MAENNSSLKSTAGKRPGHKPIDLSTAKVVVMGGGTGSSMVLRALKGRVGKLTSIVTAADDGGFSGYLRDQFGNLPAVGDALQATMALLDESGLSPEEIIQLRKMLGYRFADKHKVGNDLLHAGTEITGSLTGATSLFSRWFRTLGDVYPVSEDSRRLVLKMSNGRIIEGEHRLDDPKLEADILGHVTVDVDFDNPTRINPVAEKAIRESDLVILGPGSLYGSTGAVATKHIKGMREALQQTQVLAIINIMNDRHTTGLGVTDYVDRINGMAGATIVNYALFNNGKIDSKVLKRYAQQKETPVFADRQKIKTHQAKWGYRAFGADLISKSLPPIDDSTDKPFESLARHDETNTHTAMSEMFHSPISLERV